MSSRLLVVVSSLPLLLAAECGGLSGIGGGGTANVSIERDGEEPVVFVHDPLLSAVSLTPPVEGVVELVFDHQDPAMRLQLRVDSAQVQEGDTVSLPDPAVDLSVSLDGDAYDGSGAGASGAVSFSTLFVEGDAASLAADIDAVLVNGEGETIAVDGFVEAEVGGSDDAAAQ